MTTSRGKFFFLGGLFLGVLSAWALVSFSPVFNSKAQSIKTEPLPAFIPPKIETPIYPPQELIIPSQKIRATVIPVGLTTNGSMDTARNEKDVAWYKYGKIPGEPGAAVIAGHLDTRISPQAVFYNLKKLVSGDRIQIIDQSGEILNFEVQTSKIYAYNDPAPEIFNSQGDASYLNLVTCAGEWLRAQQVYSKRLVVFTKRI